MKIYTKKGDTGSTQLIGGKRVSKGSQRINAYGTVDELNAYIGLIRDQHIQKKHTERLLEIQDRLFTLGSLLAAEPGKKTMQLPELKASDIVQLEEWIDDMEKKLEPMRNFVLPGGHTTVSFAHIARCVCRRAEREIIELKAIEETPEIAIAYMNRLSDYLFVLSRTLTEDLGALEQPWKPKM